MRRHRTVPPPPRRFRRHTETDPIPRRAARRTIGRFRPDARSGSAVFLHCILFCVSGRTAFEGRHSPASTQDAFAPCLGWGPGVSGCSLKSVIAADSLLSWAENGNLAMQTTDVIEDAYTEWYDSLSTDEQDSFADAWPLIKEDANALLTDTSSMTGRIEDAGLNAKELPDCSEENWQALQDVIDALVPASSEY